MLEGRLPFLGSTISAVVATSGRPRVLKSESFIMVQIIS